jgi:hypothetical protein
MPLPLRKSDWAAWTIVLAITAAVSALSIAHVIHRYRTFQTGWSWDLAYYNQWYWAMTRGDGVLSVRPIAAYANEGPSVWKTNYLSPVRYIILPIYDHWPSPITLLVIHGVVFWWLVPAAYGLVRHETRSPAAGLLAVPLVLLTPLVWPMSVNDFRELQMGVPFALWAVDGVRGRSKGLTLLGVGGLLACRQEYALWVALLSLVPPRAPEDIVRRFRWCATLWFTGLAWLLIAFFTYLAVVAGWSIPGHYLGQFQGRGPTWWQISGTAAELLVLGIGSWLLLGMAAPRLAILALPWLWSLANGRWALRLIGSESWHHVRYAAPFLASSLAAGLVGWSKGWDWAARVERPGPLRALMVVSSYLLMIGPFLYVESRFQAVPRRISPSDVAPLWQWIDQVKPDDGVLAHYDLTAPLSSRRWLYSYVMDQNKPKGYPSNLPETIQWVFCHPGDLAPEVLEPQGFTRVFDGQTAQVFRRGDR